MRSSASPNSGTHGVSWRFCDRTSTSHLDACPSLHTCLVNRREPDDSIHRATRRAVCRRFTFTDRLTRKWPVRGDGPASATPAIRAHLLDALDKMRTIGGGCI